MVNRQGAHSGMVYVVNWKGLIDASAGTPIEVIVDPSVLISMATAINLVPNLLGGHHVVTVSTVAVQWPAFHVDTTHVAWRLELSSVRFTANPVPPTPPVAGVPGVGVGIEIKPNDQSVWSVELAVAAEFIRNTTSDATFQLMEMKRP